LRSQSKAGGILIPMEYRFLIPWERKNSWSKWKSIYPW